MDWLYVDDTPRAEQRAAHLSLDRALLDEVMGSEGADPKRRKPSTKCSRFGEGRRRTAGHETATS
jgi:hypothetical protein